MRMTSIEPTVFFVRDGDALRQLVRIGVDNAGTQREACLEVRAGGVREVLPLGAIAPGEGVYEVYLPDVQETTGVWLGLQVDGALQDERETVWQPQKHWDVYLVHYSHHDLGYTGLPSHVLREHVGFLDDVLRFCEETQDWPEDARFRWLVEQGYSIVEFAESRPKEAMERLARFIQNGQVEVTALLGNQTMELCGHEELVRLLYPTFRLSREYGFDIASATHNDIPGFSWGLASVLAGAGVRYFCTGIPAWYYGLGEQRVHPCWDEAAVLPIDVPGAFWWEGPDGARVLLWNNVHGIAEWQPTSYRHALRELPAMLRTLDERGYAYDVVSYTIRGGHRDNAPPTLCSAYIAKEWNRRWAYPRLLTGTHRQFLEVFAARWGHALKTLRGDLPGTDYPVAATCTPKETAINRHTHDGLLTGEKLATLASILAGYPYPQSTLERAYRNALYYDEHCWGMYHTGGPAMDGDWSEKGGFAYRAAALAHDVVVQASNRIVDQVTYAQDGYYLTLFNPLSWERTDVVRVPVHAWAPCSTPMRWDEPRQADEGARFVAGAVIGRQVVNLPVSLFEQPFELVDVSSGARVPYQVATLRDPQAAQPWAAERFAMGKVDRKYLGELVFVAAGLPALGYKTYQVVPCEEWPQFAQPAPVPGAASLTPAPATGAASLTGPASAEVVDNRFFTLELDRRTGAIVRLFDKELQRDLVDRAAPHGFAQMIVRSCESGEETTGHVRDVSAGEAGPVYTTLRLQGEAPGCPCWTQEITLYHALKRIDVHARVLRDSTPMLELYFAFPFLVQAPHFRFEATDAVIEPLRDQLPGSNTDYYAVQHWADVSGDEWGIVWTPVDAPMAEFGGLWPGYVSGAHHGVTPPGYGHPFLRPGELTKGHIYSLAMYSNFRTNFINVHPGETLYRYSFSTHAGDWREGRAREFGWNVANPPVAVWMKGPRQGPLPPSTSFCQVDAPNVMLLTFKQAEDGDGYILRLIETEGKETQVMVTMPHLALVHAFETNLVEENQRLLACGPHTVETTVRPFGIATIRVITSLPRRH